MRCNRISCNFYPLPPFKKITKKTAITATLIIAFLFCAVFTACEKPAGASTVYHTVTFNTNGGALEQDSQRVADGGFAKQPNPNPAKDDYGFGGWFTDNETFADKWDFESDTVTQNITLYAKWVELFTVTFNANGGALEQDSQRVADGGFAKQPNPNPAKDDYGFGGWFTDNETFANEWDFENDIVTGNITLYAKWVELFTVTFNANGGALEQSSQRVIDGGFAKQPNPNPAKDDYGFGGWFTDNETFADKWDFENEIVTGNITLYAKWVEALTDVSLVSSYLAGKTGTKESPAALPLAINLGTMATGTWQQLLDAVAAAGKYVELDLSACTMSGAVFNPNFNTATGKDKIVSIILPNTAESTSDGDDDGFNANKKAAFANFTALKSFSGAGLTSIGKYAFYNSDSLVSVNLNAAEGNGSIGRYAFYDCDSLAEVTLGAGFDSVGEYAFENCDKLAAVNLSEGVSSIGAYAFRYCDSLTEITLPEGLSSIGNLAFQDCSNLSAVTLPASAIIAGSAFDKCPLLASFTVTGNGALRAAEGGKALLRNNELVLYPSASGSITLSEEITSIGASVFQNCAGLTSVTLPESLTSIGGYAFRYCGSLTVINLPAELTSIGDRAFESCVGLTNIVMPGELISIGEYAFAQCGGLAEISLSGKLSSIGNYAFWNCNNLTEAILPANVASIGNCAFQDCTGLVKALLPAGLTSIGWAAFRRCENLVDVTCDAATPPATSEPGNFFDDTHANLQIKVPAASVNAYKSAAYWNKYAGKIR